MNWMISPSRNAPCPCGSGVKYKKCCLAKGVLQLPRAVSPPNRVAPAVNREQPMTYAIENLSEQELVELNHRVVERLRLLRQNRSQNQMLHFSVGERVCFDGPDGNVVTGVVERFNKKTVTIVSGDPHAHWRVHPGFLRKLQDAGTPVLRILKD